jgi:uncharacterized membrane protein YgcG
MAKTNPTNKPKRKSSSGKTIDNTRKGARSGYIRWLGLPVLVFAIFLGVFTFRSIHVSEVQALVPKPVAPPVGMRGYNPMAEYQNPLAPSVRGQVGPGLDRRMSKALDQLPKTAQPGISDISRRAAGSIGDDGWERSPSGVLYPPGKEPVPGLSEEPPGAITTGSGDGGSSGLPPGIRRPTGGGGGGSDDGGGGNGGNDKGKWLKKLALWGVGTICIPAAIGYLSNVDLFINKGPDRSSDINRRDARINAQDAQLEEYLDTLLKLNGRAGASPNATEDLGTILQIAENSHREGVYGDRRQPLTSADKARFVLEYYPEVWDRLARMSQRGRPAYQTGPTSFSPPEGPTNPIPLSRDLVTFR